MVKARFLLLFFLLLSADINLFAQKSYRHEVGLNLGEFIPLLRTQGTNFDFNYRYKPDTIYAGRLAMKYWKVTDTEGSINLGIKAGIDRIISNGNKLGVIIAADAIYEYQWYEIDQRNKNTIGAVLSIGFIYRLAERISLRTEPGFFWKYVQFRDPQSFESPFREWNELFIGNIGQVLLNFRF